MAVVQELIRTEDNGTISFGDYELSQKSKLSDYQYPVSYTHLTLPTT